ncbi:MAG: NAD(P)-dependent oxidoreductase, partial [Paracoccaceae bacterium]
MKILVTGSSGHLGEALMRHLPGLGHDPVGLDAVAGGFTDIVGSVSDRQVVEQAMAGVEAVLHTATLHKPHVATHAKQAFINTNVSGTLALLEAAVAQGVGQFVFTSTTSAFGAALVPA